MDTNLALASRVLRTELIDWHDLDFIQEDDFKALPTDSAHKLKASLLGNQFTQPFYVWEDPTGRRYCLDGRHRWLALKELIQEGHEIPYQLPATFVHCDDRQAAARLVLQYSSAYAKITEDGLANFLAMEDIDWEGVEGMLDLSALPLTEEIPLDNERDEATDVVAINLSCKKIKCTLTEAEYLGLLGLYEKYTDEQRINTGFIGWLLKQRETDFE